VNVRRNQNALINELKSKTGGPSSKHIIKPDEVQVSMLYNFFTPFPNF
jgi:hypothetical protein